MKCDEAKPYCWHCVKGGRQCGGYRDSSSPKRADAPLNIIHYVMPPTAVTVYPRLRSCEVRSFEFFRFRTAQEAFPSAEWADYLLRTAYHESAVRHALVALGALHEYSQVSFRKLPDSDFAMQQYGKAIHDVMKLDMSDPEATNVALITCILFAAIESLQGHYRSSLLHISSGLKILSEEENLETSERVTYMPRDVLRPMFVRFVTQSEEIGDSQIRLAYSKPLTDMPIPVEGFQNIDEAQRLLNTYLHQYTHFLQNLVPAIPTDMESLQPRFERHAVIDDWHKAWCIAFDELLARLGPDVPNKAKILQAWRKVVEVTLNLNFALGEMAWDEHIENFRTMIAIIEAFTENEEGMNTEITPAPSTSRAFANVDLQLSPPDQFDSPSSNSTSMSALNRSPPSMCPSKQTFSLNIGIIPPLYIACTRCRDPVIRRRALQLLSTCNRKEGIWDSNLSSRVASRIIEVEERGASYHPVLAASQLPEHARVRALSTTFSPERQGVIKLTRWTAFTGPDDEFEEVLEW